ncbi:MAG: gfo/Idh/MocA family oxidoreductase [Planctomycetes bacterium]|nr:gfo/Idh/MocA family oxidoreductase [Planctomycetota bacterium]
MSRIGIIGTGSIGRVHARHAARVGLPVGAAWDPVSEAVEALRTEHPDVTHEPSLERLLARSDIDGVVIAVPNDLHEAIAVQALQAGKHVLLEKPMATSVAACDRILAASRRAGRQVQVGFVCRRLPAVEMATALRAAGRLGRIYHAKASLYRRRGVPGLGGWFTTKARSGGGPLIDLGVHLIDAVLEVMGRPIVLHASGAVYANFGCRMKDYAFTHMWAGPPRLDGACDVEDHATALLRCEGGVTIEVNATWAMNVPDGALPDGLAIFGDAGGYRFGMQDRTLTLATEAEGRPADLVPHFVSDDPMQQAWDAQARAFRRMLDTGSPAVATAAEGRQVQAVIEAIYRSAAEGREVDVA